MPPLIYRLDKLLAFFISALMRFDAVIHPSSRDVSKLELQGNKSSFRFLIKPAVITMNKIPVSAEAQTYALPHYELELN